MLLAVGVLVGVPVAAPAGGMERWVAARGGFVGGAAAVRVTTLLRAVAPAVEDGALRGHVLDSAEVGAWTWPDGDVVVGRGLVEALDDDQLAAVLAHEIGHLLSDDRLPAMASLAGEGGRRGSEVAADELGVRVLAAAGRPPAALASMLRVVQRERGPEHPDFRSLGERIRLLEPAR